MEFGVIDDKFECAYMHKLNKKGCSVNKDYYIGLFLTHIVSCFLFLTLPDHCISGKKESHIGFEQCEFETFYITQLRACYNDCCSSSFSSLKCTFPKVCTNEERTISVSLNLLSLSLYRQIM